LGDAERLQEAKASVRHFRWLSLIIIETDG
jgi:hypothetical protein